ncbi:hypothetical protein N7508_003636 [Penicillium antarcticum]|uniref:uncharacterized protein n=1 Tax=Penicillium antarcticum TaxID=416450 RepID=UPI0023A01B79|nr:uncharacterized protein N7508_003636 [Penicillium antarcticum]KAJ5312806.1 hypothetical protein N7508_003636 [Penicillium antarcticum]
MCVQCEREWANIVSHDDNQGQTCEARPVVKGLHIERPLVEIKARMVSVLPFTIREDAPLSDLGSIISTEYEEQGGVLLDPFYDVIDTHQSRHVHRADSIASPKSTNSASPLLQHSRMETQSSSLDLPPALVESFISSLSTYDYFTSNYDSSEYENSSEGSTDQLPFDEEHRIWQNGLIDVKMIKPPSTDDSCIANFDDSNEDILEFEHADLHATTESDESDCAFVDARFNITSSVDEYTYATSEVEYNSSNGWIANLERTAACIEATVAKRIEEDYERYRCKAMISSLLNKASFFQDQAYKSDQNAELGIEDDHHLWDTEPMLRPDYADDNKEDTRPIVRSALLHVYDGIFSTNSEQEAEKQGLFAFAPITNMPGEYEGFMKGYSAAEVQDMGLQFPQHVRGCCDEVAAQWHLYYGALYAVSKEAVKKKGLEEIHPAPEQLGKYYAIMKADSKKEAIDLGMIDPQHARGCCIDAFFSIPPRVAHIYYGAMDAASTEEAESMGMQQPRPMPDKLDEYNGVVNAYSMEEAEKMKLKDIQHANECCTLARHSLPERIQYLYYGYMFGRSEEAVMQRGLKDPLRIPGFPDKYSGVVSAFSADQARQMGIFEPLRVMWDSEVPLMAEFEE